MNARHAEFLARRYGGAALVETGASELRRVVRVLNDCRESALDPFTSEELIRLVRACWACGWDVYPDQLAPWQIADVLDHGAPLMFEEERAGLRPIVPFPFVVVDHDADDAAAGDWFDVTKTPRDDLPVCLAVRNPKTGRIGCAHTPREDTLTACGKTWSDDRHVTLRTELVTCAACVCVVVRSREVDP